MNCIPNRLSFPFVPKAAIEIIAKLSRQHRVSYFTADFYLIIVIKEHISTRVLNIFDAIINCHRVPLIRKKSETIKIKRHSPLGYLNCNL